MSGSQRTVPTPRSSSTARGGRPSSGCAASARTATGTTPPGTAKATRGSTTSTRKTSGPTPLTAPSAGGESHQERRRPGALRPFHLEIPVALQVATDRDRDVERAVTAVVCDVHDELVRAVERHGGPSTLPAVGRLHDEVALLLGAHREDDDGSTLAAPDLRELLRLGIVAGCTEVQGQAVRSVLSVGYVRIAPGRKPLRAQRPSPPAQARPPQDDGAADAEPEEAGLVGDGQGGVRAGAPALQGELRSLQEEVQPGAQQHAHQKRDH